MKKLLLFLLIISGNLFSQDLSSRIINGEKDKFEWSDKFINDFKKYNPEILNKNIVRKSENGKISFNFTLVNGLVSGPFNYSEYYNCGEAGRDECYLKVSVDYLNGLKNGKFLYEKGSNENPSFKKIEGSFKNNSLNGIFRFWLAGSPGLVYTFKNDILDGPSINYYENKDENSYPLYSNLPESRTIYENGIITSREEYNRRGRVTYRSGKSREKFNKNMKDFQKSLEKLSDIF